MTIEAYDFDIDAYCVVCDRAIPAASASSSRGAAAAPSPSSSSAQLPRVGTSSSTTKQDSVVSTSLRSSDGGTSSKAMRRGHSSSGTKAALKRNKSTTKFPHHHHSTRRHHHSIQPLAERKSVSKPRSSVGEIIEVVEVDPPDSDSENGFDSSAALYCSEECRLIDEARNELTLLQMGSPSSASPSTAFTLPPPPLPPPPVSGVTRQRRRSSGGSSSMAASDRSPLAFSTLSPIPSAAPSAAVGAYDSSIPAFPFPSQSPPVLSFGARRASRGTGSYSYRPSLMERVSSSDGLASNGGIWLGPDKGFTRSHSASVETTGRLGRSLVSTGVVSGRSTSGNRRTTQPPISSSLARSPPRPDFYVGSAPPARRSYIGENAPPSRSRSSASLALLGSSFTAKPGAWLTRADSTASLSEMTAQGVMAGGGKSGFYLED
ncbi:hypothetical protein JCM10908_000804 [Rhodotorula pacifica]|uniref:uncharacterized protein n=1 Tax=Rhodotorula pacifica TaxID=1495444 RepID=UPI003171B2D7